MSRTEARKKMGGAPLIDVTVSPNHPGNAARAPQFYRTYLCCAC